MEDPWSRRDNKDPWKPSTRLCDWELKTSLDDEKHFCDCGFWARSLSLPQRRARPARCPVVTLRLAAASAVFNVAIWEMGKKKKKECAAFHFKPVLRFGPLPGRTGNINFVPMWLFRGSVLHSEAFPFLTAFWGKRWTERAELNRDQL